MLAFASGCCAFYSLLRFLFKACRAGRYRPRLDFLGPRGAIAEPGDPPKRQGKAVSCAFTTILIKSERALKSYFSFSRRTVPGQWRNSGIGARYAWIAFKRRLRCVSRWHAAGGECSGGSVAPVGRHGRGDANGGANCCRVRRLRRDQDRDSPRPRQQRQHPRGCRRYCRYGDVRSAVGAR